MDDLDYEQVVAAHHESLYRFAFSLAGNADDAAELTQETYIRLLTKGGQVRDRSKVKSWLFTTLYRVFLGWRRHATRFPHVEIVQADAELPHFTAQMADELDSETAMDAALQIEEHYRAPLVLFYLQGMSYKEIAEVLDVPIGTVMSRLSRGKELLRKRLAVRLNKSEAKPISLNRSQPS
ncbi:MAG: RNA polymerase sigma factor [Verrucomicrobiota bacterium]